MEKGSIGYPQVFRSSQEGQDLSRIPGKVSESQDYFGLHRTGEGGDHYSPMSIPAHIAIIMDGNGRWARAKGLRRIRGHREGATSVRRITEACAELGVKRLTLYAFSSDNWKRPAREIEFLWRLLRKFLVDERDQIVKKNIRFQTIGRTEALPRDIQDEIGKNISISEKNDGLVLCLALNYGGRDEIVDAARKIGKEVQEGRIDPDKIDEALLSQNLYAPEARDPDLLIRTGGDVRVSNFLLWQISYTELWVTPVMWPDFTVEHLHEAITEFGQRERRFGGLKT
jgi:undecaprenyl diphosphate synthase